MMPYEFDAERFSRWVAFVLRHHPERYDLKADRYGYVNLDELLRAAVRRYPDQTLQDLRGLIEERGRERFQVSGLQVRARYGHSIPVEPMGDPIAPPATLYHGTEAGRRDAAFSSGLRPMDRRMIHLSDTVEDALLVARRRTEQPLVLSIDAQAAHQAGISFYREGKVYLAFYIPAKFLALEPVGDPSMVSSPAPDP